MEKSKNSGMLEAMGPLLVRILMKVINLTTYLNYFYKLVYINFNNHFYVLCYNVAFMLHLAQSNSAQNVYQVTFARNEESSLNVRTKICTYNHTVGNF